MGRRGPLPADPRVRTGVGKPEPPLGMGAAGRRIWDGYVSQLAGTLRVVDGFALARLCDDVALLRELQKGMRRMAAEKKRDARVRKLKLPEGGMTAIATSHEGRRLATTIGGLASRIARQELQFGLTPASSSRVEPGVSSPLGGGVVDGIDPIEKALCGDD